MYRKDTLLRREKSISFENLLCDKESFTNQTSWLSDSVIQSPHFHVVLVLTSINDYWNNSKCKEKEAKQWPRDICNMPSVDNTKRRLQKQLISVSISYIKTYHWNTHDESKKDVDAAEDDSTLQVSDNWCFDSKICRSRGDRIETDDEAEYWTRNIVTVKMFRQVIALIHLDIIKYGRQTMISI